MSQTLINYNINLPSEEIAPFKSRNQFQKLSAGNTQRLLRSEFSFSKENEMALADINISLMLTLYFNI